MGWNYLFIPKLQRLHRWSLGMDKYFHPTLNRACDYLSMLGLKLNYDNNRGPTHCVYHNGVGQLVHTLKCPTVPAYCWHFLDTYNMQVLHMYLYIHTRPCDKDVGPSWYAEMILWCNCVRQRAQINTSRPRQNCHHFTDGIQMYFLNENLWICLRISLKFVPKGSINSIPALVQIMAWRCPCDKPLSEPNDSQFTIAYMCHSASMS